MVVIRVPVVPGYGLSNPCIFDDLYPNPKCVDPGIDVELLLFILNYFITKDASNETLQVAFVPARGFSMGNPNDTSFVNDNSVMGLLYKGLGDVTLPYMTLNSARMELFDHMGTLSYQKVFYMYKHVPVSPPDVNFFSIFNSWKSYAFLIIVGFVVLAIRKILTALCNSGIIGLISKATVINNYNYVLIGLLYAVLLNYIVSLIILMFNQDKPIPQKFTNVKDIVHQWASGQYIPLATSADGKEAVIKLLEYYGHSNIEVKNMLWDMDDIQKIAESGYEKPATLTVMDDLNQIMSEFCDLDLVEDKAATRKYTMYISRNSSLRSLNYYPTDMIHNMVSRERQRLGQKYFPPKACNVQQHWFIKYDLPFQTKAPKQPLVMQQLRAVFQWFLSLIAAGVVLFCIEFVCHWKSASKICCTKKLDCGNSVKKQEELLIKKMTVKLSSALQKQRNAERDISESNKKYLLILSGLLHDLGLCTTKTTPGVVSAETTPADFVTSSETQL